MFHPSGRLTSREVNELCPYLASETTIEGGSVGEEDDDLPLLGSFQSPDTPILIKILAINKRPTQPALHATPG